MISLFVNNTNGIKDHRSGRFKPCHTDDLKATSITELQKVINYMKNNPELKIGIRGHTDNTGTVDYNMNLSIKRAEAVYNYLVNHGINPIRLSYKGFGQTEPAFPNDTEENRSRNRRIEFMIEDI